ERGVDGQRRGPYIAPRKNGGRGATSARFFATIRPSARFPKETPPMTDKLMPGATGVLALADGTILQGIGVGAVGEAVGEVCFNTAMTGYQEILTDPSYMAQIVAFTFPHIGNVGTNIEDIEQMSGAAETAARG